MIDHQVRLPGSLATTTEPTRPATPSLLCKLVSPVVSPALGNLRPNSWNELRTEFSNLARALLFVHVDHEEISRYFSHSVFPTRLIIKLLPVLAGELHWSQPRRRLYIVSKTRF